MSNVEQLYKSASQQLLDAGYVHGEREIEIILSDLLNLDSGALFSRFEDTTDPAVERALQQAVSKRLKGAPLAYIIGNQQFMGWNLLSDQRALIPRPETEQLVEELVREIRDRHLENGSFLEIGTGAGPIALALKKYFPNAEVTATDISEEAIDLATENARRLKVEVQFLVSDLFADVPKNKYDVIVANLPYVPTQKLAFVSEQILDWEPMIAIEAGEDGLQYITPFLEQISQYLSDDGLAAIEFWHTHGDPVKDLAEKYLPNHEVDIRKDLAGFDRYAFFLPN